MTQRTFSSSSKILAIIGIIASLGYLSHFLCFEFKPIVARYGAGAGVTAFLPMPPPELCATASLRASVEDVDDVDVPGARDRGVVSG